MTANETLHVCRNFASNSDNFTSVPFLIQYYPKSPPLFPKYIKSRCMLERKKE